MACRSCRWFDEDETWGSKGHCDYLGTYVYGDDESCSHYEKRGGGGGCYMTSACCDYRGLPDDCRELTAMRRLRDAHMLHTEAGRRMIEDYYRVAPTIVERIDASEQRGALYEYIFSVVRRCADLVERDDFEDAVTAYQGMVDHLRAAVL